MGVFAVMVFFSSQQVLATQSTNYRFDETAIGTNGLIQSSSANFRANAAIGDLSVGNASSANFQVEAGTQTDNDPVLSFQVIDASADFGDLSATATATATSTFSVRNYTSYGYVVQIYGSVPTNGTHTIDALATSAPSQTGVNQFGLNLVANTLPTSVGANPDNGDFGFGLAESNYDVANEYRFVSGDIIASAPKSSGETTYTISYILNVEPLTPGGQYNTDQTVIVIGTY